MKNYRHIITALVMSVLLVNCSRKTHPSENATATAKPVVKKVRTPVPKVITVNDNAATKTVDGRLYYDLEGHRYWRNNKDGKYYLYNKSMHDNPAFQKP